MDGLEAVDGAEGFRMVIEEGKVREFARALHSENPEHQGPEAVVPGTYLTLGRLSWEPPEFDPIGKIGFVVDRMLHGEEEYVFHGPPPRAGQTLYGSSELVDRYEREGGRGGPMQFAVVRTAFRDASGALVAEQRSTIIETSGPPEGS